MPDLWPFQPEGGITEQIDWLTDIRQSPQGEMRDSLAEPRQSLNHSFFWDGEEHAVALGLIEANPVGDWYLPLWTDITTGVDVLATDTVINCDTDGDYVAGGYAVIYLDRFTYVVVQIDAVNAGSITLTAQVGSAFTDAVVAPIRTAFSPNGFEFERRFHDFVVATMRFRIRDTSETAASPFSQYLGLEVITDVSLATSPLAGGIRQTVSIFDNGFGPVHVEPLRDVLENAYAMNFQDETLAARKRRREWLKAVRGRDTPFWLPSRSREMRLASPALSTDTVISIHPIFSDVTQYVGKHLSIAGTIYREITAAVENGPYHDLTIAAPGQALNDPEICILRKYRFDSDQVEINHINAVRSSGQVVIREVAA